jgi:hypothetical protein
MNDDNKYFVPSIEDFRIGYEFEFQGIPKGWHKMIFSEENSLKNMKYNIEKLKDAVRVPYLTKEQIENEGWKYKETSNRLTFIRKISLKVLSWKKEDNDINIYIDLNDEGFYDSSNIVDLFSGECKSINEFRYICKLLKI